MAQIVKLKRTSVAGKVPSTSNLQLGELAVNTNDGRIFFKKNDGSDSIEHILTTDSITTGSITLTGTLTTNTLTLSGLSAQNSETDVLTINGSNVIGTRQLGSNAFNSTTIPTNNNQLTNGAGYATGDNFDEDGTFSSLRAQGTTKGDVGLGNVTNESKSTMFTSPTFTGTPLSTTPSANDNSTKIATTAYVQTELTDLIGNAPAAFDTLGEISASLAADSGALDSLTTVVSGKLQKDQNLSDLTNVSTARTNLGVDASGTDNSTDVTLGGSYDYITISGQTITRNQIDLTTDVTGVLPSANLDSDTAHLSGTQTFTGAKTFTKLGVGATHNSFDFYNDGTSYFNGNTTVNANLTVDAGSISISADGSNATTLTESDSGDFTIDAVDDIRLDAGGNDIVLRGSGTEFGRFKRDNSDFVIKSAAQDKDIVFRGNDGGSTITALTLNMSEAGSATFHGGIANAGTIAAGTWNGSVIASAYLDSDTAHLSGTQTFTGEKTFSSASVDNTNFQNNIRAYNTILMANESSTNRWQIVNNYSGQLLGDNSFGLRYHNGSNWSSQVFNLSTSGDIEATGDVVAYASSDERYKDNVTPIENPNEKLKQIGGYTFDWNDKHKIFKGQHDVGVIAQEIEKVLPEIVETRESGYKAVKYEKIVALLIESNKELLKRVEELESKIK